VAGVARRLPHPVFDPVPSHRRNQSRPAAFLDVTPDIFFGIQLRFLWQIADVDARLRSGFAVEILVEASHDSQQCRFAGSVQSEHADPGKKLSEMSSMMNRFGGTILATRFIVYMYCAIASPGRK
jgi:hypothetical protein